MKQNGFLETHNSKTPASFRKSHQPLGRRPRVATCRHKVVDEVAPFLDANASSPLLDAIRRLVLQ